MLFRSDTSTLQNPTDICYNNYGAFDVMLIACNANGCDTLVITNFITELQNPTDSIWQSNDTLYSLPGQSYQWYELSGGLISGATNSYYVFTQPGSYYCLVNDSVGCVATSNIIVITALAENQNHENLNFIIPNPNNGSFTIELNMALSADANLRIFDMQGRIVYNSAIKNQREKIDSDLSNEIGRAHV